MEPSGGKDARKIGMFYANFMDEARVEALDADPLAPFIEMLRRADTRADLAELMAKTFFGSIFGLSIGIDAKTPDKYAVRSAREGLVFRIVTTISSLNFRARGLPTSPILRTFWSLIGWEMPEECAAAILTFETAIAKASWTLTERQDPEKTYNPMAVAQLARARCRFRGLGFCTERS